ncbi:hypothetical protein QJS66_16890 [Kocuria rhizophila]|nr:hypothetical protein QJS66_16890 [Kocuria rhizophila]
MAPPFRRQPRCERGAHATRIRPPRRGVRARVSEAFRSPLERGSRGRVRRRVKIRGGELRGRRVGAGRVT